MKALFITIFLLGISTLSFSQNDKEVRKQLRAGNKQYKKERYSESEITYRKALEANARSADAAYNLGNSLYKQSKFPEAGEQYQAAIKEEKDKGKLALAWHNTGNIFMSGKDYAKSIEAYKQALRNNPNDDETRYNLALAQKLLADQQQDQQNQDQNKDQQKQDQQKDQKQDQNKDQQKDQQKDNQDQNKDQQQNQDQQQQQNSNQMSKQNAQQILDALMQNEKNTQEKVKDQQVRQQQQRKTEKNW